MDHDSTAVVVWQVLYVNERLRPAPCAFQRCGMTTCAIPFAAPLEGSTSYEFIFINRFSVPPHHLFVNPGDDTIYFPLMFVRLADASTFLRDVDVCGRPVPSVLY